MYTVNIYCEPKVFYQIFVLSVVNILFKIKFNQFIQNEIKSLKCKRDGIIHKWYNNRTVIFF